MKLLPACLPFFILFGSPLIGVTVKTNNNLGMVEVITRPTATFDSNTGQPIKDVFGFPVLGWDVLSTIQGEKEIQGNSGDTVWLHARTEHGYQFLGWEGTGHTYKNPVEVPVDQVATVVAMFGTVPEIEKLNPFVSGWFYNGEMGGWFYTNDSMFPFIWNHQDQKWWRFEKTVSGKRYYTVFENGKITGTKVIE